MRSILLLALALLAGCAERQALFVVLPSADGGTGAITVSDAKGKVVLDKPFAATEIRDGAAQPSELKPDEIRALFAKAMAAQPILPVRHRLYFQPNSDQLTAESEQAFRAVFDDIRRRPVHQVEVIGFTDSTGTQEANQRLSLQRAGAIRDRLVAEGIAASAITIAGRGKLDPEVPTADQVNEPRNRRVIIAVR